MSEQSELVTIALVGRTNVGKSTLFNRLTGGRMALVAPSPGLTRDRREQIVEYRGYRFRIVDTGGIELDSDDTFAAHISEQAGIAIDSADAVWLVLSVVEGITPHDEELYRWLLKRKGSADRPLLALVNKVDNAQRKAAVSEFYALGLDVLYPVSALHGQGFDEALEATAALVPGLKDQEPEEERDETRPIRIAFVGKPNVGKSSLVNRILGESRMIVSEVPGTTREPIDSPIRRAKRDYLLIDTAGIRRKSKTKEYLDKVGALTSLGALRRADVAVLVLDASEDVSEQDAKIAGYIVDERRAVVLAVNKWDLAVKDNKKKAAFERSRKHKLRFLDFARAVDVSAETGLGMDSLFQEISAAYAQFSRSIQTADLNRVIPLAMIQHQPPNRGRSPTRIYYGSQVRVRPPVFQLFTNHPDQITTAYTRYFANQLRYHFGFQGSPVGIEWRGRS